MSRMVVRLTMGGSEYFRGNLGGIEKRSPR